MKLLTSVKCFFAFIVEYLLRAETAFGGSFQIPLPYHPVVTFEKKINQSFIREKKKITISD